MRDGSRGSSQLTGPLVERVRKVSASTTHLLMFSLLRNEARLARCVHCVSLLAAGQYTLSPLLNWALLLVVC